MAIIIVALVHALLGYVLITGLAYNAVKEAVEDLNTFDVKEEPPPPEEEPPPPPPDQPTEPPPVVAPPPIVQNPNPPPVQITTVRTPPPVFIPTPTAPPAPPPAPPAPAAPVVSKAAGPRGNPADWVSADDYPPGALRREESGRSGIAWEINTQGRVENCRVTSSSGSRELDDTACRMITRRGRYSPALDQAGNPIRSRSSRNVVWVLPDN